MSESAIRVLLLISFSDRPDTIAEKLPEKISHTDKNTRSKKLISLSDKKLFGFQNMNIGQITNVLFERTRNEGLITGFTSNYIRVEYPWQSTLAGQIRKVKLKNILETGRMSIELID